MPLPFDGENSRFHSEHAPVDTRKATKIRLNMRKIEQQHLLVECKSGPLKQCKLSSIDVRGFSNLRSNSKAIDHMFARSQGKLAPLTPIRSDDNRRAQIAALPAVLFQIEHARKEPDAHAPGLNMCGGTDLWHA